MLKLQAHLTIKETKELTLHAVISFGISSNVYIIKSNGEIALIDAGYGPPHSNLIESLSKFNISTDDISKVLITHRHKDHTNGLKQLINKAKPEIYVHKYDAEIIIRRLRLNRRLVIRIDDSYNIKIGSKIVKTIHTPGHTAGSTCYLIDEMLFSGDLVFANGGFGRTDLPTGNFNELVRSLEKVSKLNDVEMLFPGHGELVLSDAQAHIRLALKIARLMIKQRRE